MHPSVAPVTRISEDEQKALNARLLRVQILDLEQRMLALPPEEHLDIPVRHYFANGLYAREVVIPAGALVVGKIHRAPHINVISKGRISVETDRGMETIEAPFTFVAPPGTKRAGYAHEETVWTTFHASQETDLEKLETELIAPTFEALTEEEKKLCLGSW